MSRRLKKYTSLSLILSMLLSLIPGSFSGLAEAAGDDFEVTFANGQHVGNLSYAADNTFLNFYTKVEGFKQTEEDKDAKYDWAKGDIFAGVDDNEATVKFQVNVADNTILRNMAESGHAEMLTGFAVLRRHSGFLWTRHSSITVNIDGKNIINERTGSSQRYNKSAKAIIKPNSVITIEVWGEGDDDGEAAGVRGFYLKFQDLKRPVIDNYTFTGNGAERLNENINQQELYVKRDENITLSYNFSEPVRPTTVVKDNSDYFLRHKLFINDPDTGLPAAGQQQYLQNTSFTRDTLTSYQKKISYKYTGVPFHNSSNLPLRPLITGGTTGGAQMDLSLDNKLKEAVLSDAAGNKAVVNLNTVPSSGSNAWLNNKSGNPFDFDRGGFRVIVDAVRPKYSKTANGIQPEILTGVTLNKGDVIDFTLQMTEEAIAKTGWDEKKTFILFNNGMKAYYVAGKNTRNWSFRMTVPDGLTVETPLLKAIAVSNDAKGGSLPINMDTDVIQDYAGNLMIQPANFDGIHEEKIPNIDGGDFSLANSKIDWANLFIDNTKPIIGYRFEAQGASDTAYSKKGKVTIDANDPSIKVPHLDPTEADRGAERPSRGIYRPSNMSAEASPSVGLVYYWWSQDKADPFASVAGDNNAALKRYALSAKQPSEELYPGEFQNVQLSVVNNKTNLLSPPPEAFEAGNSGEWYLHTWTADMTWDSARELMQYEKKKAYVASHQSQYDAWIAEAPGSKADKIFYADNQALAAVGQYGDLSVWKVDDFKQDDSNWTHEVGILKLDNQGPAITMAAEDSTTVQALVKDPHSGVKNVQYQWVKDGDSPQDIKWADTSYSGNTVTRSTYEDIDEDGAYWLYLKALDNAGNETVKTPQEKAVVVSSEATIPTQFTPEANPDYVRSHDVMFQISGVTPDYVGYAFSSSSIHPESDNEYTGLEASTELIQPLSVDNSLDSGEETAQPEAPAEPNAPAEPEVTANIGPVAILKLLSEGPVQPELTPLAAEETPSPESGAEPATAPAASAGATEPAAVGAAEPAEDNTDSKLAAMGLNASVSEATYSYVIPAKSELNGTQYIHLMVKHSDRTYYYSKAYYFDNEAPVVYFSPDAIAYPLPQQKTRISVSEFYSKTGLVSKYKWVKQETGAEVPTESSTEWKDVPAGGSVSIDDKSLDAGQIAEYRLYVLAVDGAGNSSVTASGGTFKVSASSKPEAPVSDAKSSLIYLSGDAKDGYTAIVKLSLETEDKTGYEYSVSPDNGASWINWKPYTNFVAVKVPTGDPTQLQVWVKYRTPGGLISEAAKLDIEGASTTEQPVYALATLSVNSPVNATVGADIEFTLPPGIRVMPSKINPSVPVRTGNSFKIYENGYYSFDLTDLGDPDRTDTLYLVVKNIDGTPPEGTVEYSNMERTNGNVVAYLQSTSEPVTITNNSGKNAYTFKENGTFVFEIKDAAGNTNTVEATVKNINKEAPKVKVVRSYQYGLNGSSTFNTVKDNNGNVLFSTGTTVTVEKADASAKAINIISQAKSITLTENGTASFTVVDEYGNTTVIKEKVTNILSAPPEADKIAYTFVDAEGKAVPADQIVTIGGQKYAKGKVKVTISGSVTAPNKMFFGVRPIEGGAAYSNQISKADGTFSYSRDFESSGSAVVAISDLLGNVNKVPVTIAGLDNTPPELTLNNETAGIVQNKKDFNFRADLGGFTVSDNVSEAAGVKVSVSGLDLSKLGRQRVAYTAVDQVGNETVVYQDVVVVKDGGLLIFGNDTLISASSGESALFNTNTLTFKVSGYNIMKVAGVDKVNQAGTFDILYYPGLYREGQLKLVKQKLTYDELVSSQFKVTFPKTGWYTIVVRTQERDREFATFFIGNMK
ncbi:hypothetical protein GC101_19140 [Paenibacillus sp. LMG 31459]|uniref:Ig-like domain-containing protein n=1 Tax=Paenibacillus phytohabitans TaxID=2654978 RepID=A0ABX1YIX5_9BACL|nr:hypothetical protein [Paenibacillus phytohabitans]NOU80980.1 hypothetical protein [Paenibacillus phytohabitans]